MLLGRTIEAVVFEGSDFVYQRRALKLEVIMYLLVLFLAVAGEIFGDSCMKLSDGLRYKLPLLGTIVGYAISFYLFAWVLTQMDLGLAYAIWTGIGVIFSALVGMLFWHELMNKKKIIGLALIVVGIIILDSVTGVA